MYYLLKIDKSAPRARSYFGEAIEKLDFSSNKINANFSDLIINHVIDDLINNTMVRK